MPCSMTSSTKKRAVMRLPTSRPYMSGKTAMTVSTSPSATERFSCSRSMRPCISVRGLRFAVDLRPNIQINRLPLRIRLQRLQPQLPPQAAALHAAEGSFQMDAAAGVDRDVAGLHGTDHAHGP